MILSHLPNLAGTPENPPRQRTAPPLNGIPAAQSFRIEKTELAAAGGGEFSEIEVRDLGW